MQQCFSGGVRAGARAPTNIRHAARAGRRSAVQCCAAHPHYTLIHAAHPRVSTRWHRRARFSCPGIACQTGTRPARLCAGAGVGALRIAELAGLRMAIPPAARSLNWPSARSLNWPSARSLNCPSSRSLPCPSVRSFTQVASCAEAGPPSWQVLHAGDAAERFLQP